MPPAAALLLACGLGLGLLAGAGSVARAQGPDKPAKTPVLPEPLIPEAIRELVARLSDAEVRQLSSPSSTGWRRPRRARARSAPA
jgi:hypothetical protein